MSTLSTLTTETLATRCNADGEFDISARHWTGGLRIKSEGHELTMRVTNGKASAGDPGDGAGVITLEAPDELWDGMLAAVPPRFQDHRPEMRR